MTDRDHPLKPIVVKWLDKLHKAHTYKQQVFGKDAQECMQFFNGPHDWLYSRENRVRGAGFTAPGDDEDGFPEPSFRMSANKVAEMVQLFGPVLYQKNPQRTITPRDYFVSPVPPPSAQQDMMALQMFAQMTQMMEQEKINNLLRAKLLEAYLNYTPVELNLKDELRKAIDEAIIKGAGICWTELATMPTGVRLVGTFYDTIDNFLMDPDGETPDQCMWVARRCTHPVWQVEKEYGLEQGSLKGNSESWDSQSEYDPDKERANSRKDGGTNDLLTYWKIFSRMGIGGRLQGAPEEMRAVLDSYGDYCYLVVADSIPYPLNLPPKSIEGTSDQDVQHRLQWPVPFWADRAWPCTILSFHEVPRQCWPMSHLKPGMGELKFLNWAFSMLAGKVRTTCRDFIAVAKSAAENIKSKIQHAGDLTMIEVDAVHQDINKMVQFLQHPGMNKDPMDVVVMVNGEFEKRVGLNELMYGESKRQLRSAAEAEIKQENMSVRPEDMRNKIEDCCSEIAKKEAIAARSLLTQQDVATVLGPVGAMMWMSVVATADPKVLVHQLQYRIEADSTRKPNREKAVQNMNDAMKNLFGPLLKYGQETGQVDMINALIKDWAKSLDLDVTEYLMKPPPPPPPPPKEKPKISVSIKGEELKALGLMPGVLDDFDLAPTPVPPPPPAPPGGPPGPPVSSAVSAPVPGGPPVGQPPMPMPPPGMPV